MTTRADLVVDPGLAAFVESELLPGLGIPAERFWQGLASLVAELGPRNRALLERRDALQAQIDGWYRERRDGAVDVAAEEAFLRSIGYLAPEPPAFSVSTEGVDPEFSHIPGPQLVVPITNARYALNAANARWGSLYDALYGTDAIDESDGATRGGAYNPVRGAKVIARARASLDLAAPLAGVARRRYRLRHRERRAGGQTRPLATAPWPIPPRSSATTARRRRRRAVLLRIHGLHIEIVIDRRARHRQGRSGRHRRRHPGGRGHHHHGLRGLGRGRRRRGQDAVYRNWLGLMTGDLTRRSGEGRPAVTRRLTPDRRYARPAGGDAHPARPGAAAGP